MTRSDNQEAIQQLFDRLHGEFGRLAPQIIRVMAECVGKYRLRFPDLQMLYRQERNQRIRNEFNGRNYEELAIRYNLKIRQTRRIILQEE